LDYDDSLFDRCSIRADGDIKAQAVDLRGVKKTPIHLPVWRRRRTGVVPCCLAAAGLKKVRRLLSPKAA